MSDGTWSIEQAEDEAARALLGRMLVDPAVELPPVVVIDVGAIEGRGSAVVEANPAWASGLRDADPAAVLEMLRGCVVPDGAGEGGGDCGRART